MSLFRRAMRPALILLAAAALGAVVPAAAEADVMRIVVIVAASQADYEADLKEQHNAIDLMKKGELETGYVVADPAKLTVGTVTVWESEDKFNAVAATPEYKALLDRLKYATRSVSLLTVQ